MGAMSDFHIPAMHGEHDLAPDALSMQPLQYHRVSPFWRRNYGDGDLCHSRQSQLYLIDNQLLHGGDLSPTMSM